MAFIKWMGSKCFPCQANFFNVEPYTSIKSSFQCPSEEDHCRTFNLSRTKVHIRVGEDIQDTIVFHDFSILNKIVEEENTEFFVVLTAPPQQDTVHRCPNFTSTYNGLTPI